MTKAQGCEARATLGCPIQEMSNPNRVAPVFCGGQIQPDWSFSHHAAIVLGCLHSFGFSTKERRPLLRDKISRDALHGYLGGISKRLECPPLLVGGIEDHVHLLARFGRTITQAEWVKELKRVSNI